jgi:hypothetical protein
LEYYISCVLLQVKETKASKAAAAKAAALAADEEDSVSDYSDSSVEVLPPPIKDRQGRKKVCFQSKSDIQILLEQAEKKIVDLQSVQHAPHPPPTPPVVSLVPSAHGNDTLHSVMPTSQPCMTTSTTAMHERYTLFNGIKQDLKRSQRAQEMEEELIVMRYAMFGGKT